MPAIAIEVIIIAFLLVFNGLLAMTEIAIVTSRRTRLKRLADRGDGRAAVALSLAEAPTRFLSTVQVGITLIGILAGAFGGATIAEQLAVVLERVPGLARWSESIALGIVVAAISFFSLVIGEIVPKRIALSAPERIALIVSRPMRGLATIARPIVAVLTFFTNALLRLLRVRETTDVQVTEEEIRAVVELGRVSGVVQAVEQQMVEAVFRFGDRRVGAVMTPRTDMDWLDIDDDPAEIKARIAARPQSVQVVCQGSSDNVIGILHAEALLARCLTGEPFELRPALIPPLYVPASLHVLRLLETFREQRRSVAIALDEYGTVQGFVSLDDLLEEIVGDLPAPGEEFEPPMTQREDGTWVVEGWVPIEDITTKFGLDPIPTDERSIYRTLAGFVMARLGRVPKVGDHFSYGEVGFEVLDMDGRRVDAVLVKPKS